MTIINPNGQLIKWGGKSVKDVAGLDVASLMVGSGGVLSVIVDVTLRLIPYPSHLFDHQRRHPIRTPHYKIQTTPINEILRGIHRKFDPNGIFYRSTESPKT
jgi:FAD/FMN-containing dehydrogenase